MKKTTFITLLLLTGVCAGRPAFAADPETNKKILKDAIVGAVTGAVAAEASKDEGSKAAPAATPDSDKNGHWYGPHKNFSKKHHHHDKRPHGWDMGKKTGWGDNDVPPGLAKKGSD